MNDIRVGLLGLGNVGAGVVKLLEDNASAIETRLGGRVIVSPDWQDRAIPGPSFPDKDPAALRLKRVAE